MKAIYRLFLYVLLLCPFKGISQHVLNGSFEINTFPYCVGGVGCAAGYFTYGGIPYVFGGDSSIQCEAVIAGVYINTAPPPCNSPIHSVPDGTLSFGMLAGSKSNDSTNHIAFELSSPLQKGKPYVIRYASGSWWDGYIPSNYFHIGLSHTIYRVEKKLSAVIPLDQTGYRDYALAFIADSDYKYISVYQTMSDTTIDRPNILDNIRLDTCVSLNSNGVVKFYGGTYNPFPITLQVRYSSPYGQFWSTGDTTEKIQVNKGGIYTQVTYYNANCAIVDSIEVVDLRSIYTDTTVCEGSSVILTARPDARRYVWSTGETTQSIIVNSAGTYKVTVQYATAMTLDSFSVHYLTLPNLDLPLDTSFCAGSSVTLNASNSNYKAYLWNTGDTSSKLIVADSGTYIVKASKSFCSLYDTVHVSMYAPSSLNLPSDTSFCKGASCTLKISNTDYTAFLWSTGSTVDSIVVNDTGTFFVKASNTYCTAYDTVHTHVITPDTLGLISDTSICQETDIVLNATHSSYNHYQWNTGDTLPYITVSNAGFYKVIASDGSCQTSDSTNVHYYPKRYVHLPKDTAVCFDELKAIILDAGQWKTYSWYPTGEHTRTIAAAYPEIYIVVVTDSNNCSATDTALVEEDCPADLFIPNAFTPNGDAINEFFAPKGKGITSFTMKIYDRWGRLLFESNDIAKGWDGTIKGTACPADVYFYAIAYKVKKNNTNKQVSGNVTLLR